MARLCVRIQSNNHPKDSKLDALRTQKGDVVSVVEDGHEFSQSELNSGQYHIVDVPGVSPEEFSYLIESVSDKENNIKNIRSASLDIQTILKMKSEGIKQTSKKDIDLMAKSRISK